MTGKKIVNKAKVVGKRLSDLDRLSYFMNIAFGASLLMVSIAFVTGNVIGEDNRVVNGIEIFISVGLIVLGVERIIHQKRRIRKEKELVRDLGKKITGVFK